MAVGSPRQDSEPQRAVVLAAEYQAQRGGYLVVTDYQVVARLRIERYPGVAKVAGDDARLKLLVVINPQLDGVLGCFHIDHGRRASGLGLVADVGLWLGEAATEVDERGGCGVRQDHGEVVRVREGRHHLEAAPPDVTDPCEPDDGSDSYRSDRPAEATRSSSGAPNTETPKKRCRSQQSPT